MEDLDTSKAKSQSCSHSHTTAVINQDDRNYNNLEQTNPKAICEQELSAECFVKRITTKPFHPQPADNGQSAEQICKEAQRRADLKQSRHTGKEKSKGKVTKSSLCCGFFFFHPVRDRLLRRVLTPCTPGGHGTADTHVSCQAACLQRAWRTSAERWYSRAQQSHSLNMDAHLAAE